MNVSAKDNSRQRLISWVALSIVYVVWGTTYLAIRVGVRDLPPLLFAGVRYVVAGAILYPIALRISKRRGLHARSRPNAKEWLAGGVIGILLLFLGNGGLTIAEKTIPSGFAAVLVATVPLWMILFARLLQRQPITWRKALSLVVGIGGVAVLVGNEAWSGGSSGVVIVLGASAAWGFGSVVSHQLTLSSNAIFAAAIEMLGGGGVLLVVASASGEFSKVQWSSVSTSSWIALAYLIGPGSILAFTAYNYALSHLSVTTVSTYAYVNPVVAVLAGTLFLGERLTLHEALGAALVLGSIIIIQRPARSHQRARHIDSSDEESAADGRRQRTW